MRTASEVAVRLVADWDKSSRTQLLSVALDSLKLDIEAALTAFRNEAIEEAAEIADHHAMQIARPITMEQKVADHFARRIAEKIRALKK